MVRLSCLVSLALAAQGLHAAPSASRDQGGLQTRDISASEPRAIPPATQRPGGKTAAQGEAERIAKAPAPNGGGTPTPGQGNAQQKGSRGSTKFGDTPQGAAGANKPNSPATQRPGGKTAAEGQADRIAKAPAPNSGGFPTPAQEERKQLVDAQRKGSRGSTKFKDTPEGAAFANKAKNPPTERPGGKTAAEGQAERIAKGNRQ